MQRRNTIVDSYNDIVDTMNELIKDGYDVWAFHNDMQGFGFNLILDKKFIYLHIGGGFDDQPNTYYISSHEKKSNILDPFCSKQLGERETSNYKEVKKLVLSLI